MGQRLNISVRENGRILASGYWHWGGYTDNIIDTLSHLSFALSQKDKLREEYTPEELAVGLLELVDCKVPNDRNDGRLKLGHDQDTSDTNVIIDLDKDYVQLIDCFYHYHDEWDEEVIMNIPIKDYENILNEMADCEEFYFYENKKYRKIM